MNGDNDGEVTTRDLDTLTENGPSLTAMETPSARAAYTERPAFSPVAQPGLSPEIWYHTVPGEGKIANYAPPSNGMIGRLNGSAQRVIVDLGNGGKRRKKKKRRGRDRRDWDRGDPGYDTYMEYLETHGKPPPHGRIPG